LVIALLVAVIRIPPRAILGILVDDVDEPIENAALSVRNRGESYPFSYPIYTDQRGQFHLPMIQQDGVIEDLSIFDLWCGFATIGGPFGVKDCPIRLVLPSFRVYPINVRRRDGQSVGSVAWRPVRLEGEASLYGGPSCRWVRQ
jgi:hypothetical protein